MLTSRHSYKTLTLDELVADAEGYATEIFKLRNILYAGLPYTTHLKMVVKFAHYFRNLLKVTDEEFKRIIVALWLHDVIEDCGINYNEIAKRFGGQVADWVWALTGFGRNRVERNQCVEPKIKGNLIPTFMKMCDKLANLVFSKFVDSDSGMYDKYVSEWKDFGDKYYLPELHPMSSYYQQIISVK